MKTLTPRSLVLLASAAVSLTVAGCAQSPNAPLAVAVIPPQSAPPPPVALSSRVVEQAASFRAYLRKAATVSPAFKGGAEVERSLALAAQFEPKQMGEGLVAYAALIALQDPQFVASVRTFAVDPTGRKDMAARLIRNPGYVAALPQATNAAGLVAATLNAEGARVSGVGERVKQAAYDVQHQKWSKEPVVDPAGRLAKAKSISALPMTPVPSEVEELGRAIPGGEGRVSVLETVAGGPVSGDFTPLLNRGLALAALAALGEAGDDNAANVAALLSEPTGGACLNMTKLNLYQCLSVARPYYEDVFCLGQHELIDTGQCIAKGAGPVSSKVASRPVSLAPGDTPGPVAFASQIPPGPPVGGAASIGMRP